MFFAVEVLFLLPSNKKTKVKMKMKAKKTNSASENAILYPVTQTDSLIAFNFVNEANDTLAWLYVPLNVFLLGVSTQKIKIYFEQTTYQCPLWLLAIMNNRTATSAYFVTDWTNIQVVGLITLKRICCIWLCSRHKKCSRNEGKQTTDNYRKQVPR